MNDSPNYRKNNLKSEVSSLFHTKPSDRFKYSTMSLLNNIIYPMIGINIVDLARFELPSPLRSSHCGGSRRKSEIFFSTGVLT